MTFTTDSEQLADTMAVEVAGTEFTCCAHIEGPIRRVHRWHGHRYATERWRVEVEVVADGVDALLDHVNGHHGDEVHDLVVTSNVTHLAEEPADAR